MFDTLPTSLKDFRTSIGVTQSAMANAMGMPFRSYQDIEAGKNPVRPIHVKAAYFAAIVFAAEKGLALSATDQLQDLVYKAHDALEQSRSGVFE